MAQRLRKDCKLPEDERLWLDGRGFIVRGLPWSEAKLREIPPFEFENCDRLVEAYVYERSIERDTYKRMLSNLDAELAEVEAARVPALESELDAGGLVDYAVHVITHAGTLWRSARPEQRAPLQALLFPEGLRFGKAGFVEPR